MLADDYVIDLCDLSSTTVSEDAVRPKRDMDAEKPMDNAIENEAIRPKCDMDAGKSDGNEIENDAVRPKRDDNAAKLSMKTRMLQRQTSRKRMQMTEQQQPQKRYMKQMTKLQVKMINLEGFLKKEVYRRWN